MGTQTTNLASLNLSTLKQFPIPELSPEEQKEIVATCSAARDIALASAGLAASARQLRQQMLGGLLSGSREIPESYDAQLESA